MLQHAKSFMISFLCVYEYIMHPSVVTVDHHQTRVSFRYQQQRMIFQWSLTAEMLAGEERLSVCVINLYPSLWAIKHDHAHVLHVYAIFLFQISRGFVVSERRDLENDQNRRRTTWLWYVKISLSPSRPPHPTPHIIDIHTQQFSSH